MLSTTDDLRIDEIKELSTPQEVMREIPRTLTATRVVTEARNAIHAILNGTDDRLLVVAGPCSVHDPMAAVDYAARLAKEIPGAFFADQFNNPANALAHEVSFVATKEVARI